MWRTRHCRIQAWVALANPRLTAGIQNLKVCSSVLYNCLQYHDQFRAIEQAQQPGQTCTVISGYFPSPFSLPAPSHDAAIASH